MKELKLKLSSGTGTTTNPKEEGQGNDAKQITAGLETDKEKKVVGH